MLLAQTISTSGLYQMSICEVNKEITMQKAMMIVLLTVGVGMQVPSVLAANKAVLLGIDGVQWEKVQALDTPNFDRLNINKAYTGGMKGYDNEQLTSSGPGWATILTGVWVNKHNVDTNSAGLANADFPSIFKRINNANPVLTQASLVHWSPINTQFFTDDIANVERVESGISDADVTSATISEINKGTDFVFAHLDDPDHHGHSTCFGSAYNKSIITADQQLGEILDAIEVAEKQSGDNWLLMVTTDHGRDSLGCGHGAQKLNQKTIFIGSNEPVNAELTEKLVGANNDFSGLYGYAAQTSIVPTLLTHLGIKVEQEWKLDGPSLIGELGVRKLVASTDGYLQWINESDDDIRIYRNDILVDVLSAQNNSWQDNANTRLGTVDYVLASNANPVAFRHNVMDVNAGLSWNLSRGYFFRSDTQYVRYNKVLDKAEDGYPRAVNESNWPGLGAYRENLVASFHKDSDTAYFFTHDGQYLSYDLNTDSVRDGYPKAVDETTWSGLGAYADNIVATLRWKGSKVYFFLEDGHYLRYDLVNDSVDSGYPKPINDSTWPGLGAYAQQITAAIYWDDTRAYFFLDGQRYIRYSIASDRVDSGYPKQTNDSTWPGLLGM